MVMKHFKAAVICVAVLLLISVFTGCDTKKEINADTWLLSQRGMMSDIIDLSKNMDTVYTLYIMGRSTDEDFLDDIFILTHQQAACEKVYKQLKDQYVIKPGSMSYSTKKGIESIEAARELIRKVLQSSVQNGQPLDRHNILYLYLAYQEQLKNYIVDYSTALAVLNEEIKSQTIEKE
jgi:hypothetical protein